MIYQSSKNSSTFLAEPWSISYVSPDDKYMK